MIHKSDMGSASSGNTADYVLDDLRRRIVFRLIDGNYKFTESNLAADYNVSRDTVRYALNVLSSEMLVEISNSGRKKIIFPSMKDAEDDLRFRVMIEQEAARICMERPETNLSGIAVACATFLNNTNGSDQEKYNIAVVSNMKFHRSLIEAADSIPILRCWNLLEPFTFLMTEQNYLQRPARFNLHKLYTEHSGILNMIIRRDESVFDIIKQHIMDTEIILDNYVDPGKLNKEAEVI